LGLGVEGFTESNSAPEPGLTNPVRLNRLRRLWRFRGGLVFKAHRLCVSLNSRLESHKEEEDSGVGGADLASEHAGGGRS